MPMRGKVQEDDPLLEHPPHYLHELPKEEEERFEKLFIKLGRGGDGKIDIENLSDALKEFGLHHRYAEVSINTEWLVNVTNLLWQWHTFPCVKIGWISQILFTWRVLFYELISGKIFKTFFDSSVVAILKNSYNLYVFNCKPQELKLNESTICTSIISTAILSNF